MLSRLLRPVGCKTRDARRIFLLTVNCQLPRECEELRVICGTRGVPDTVAPFRAWRGSRDLVAQSPKFHAPAAALVRATARKSLAQRYNRNQIPRRRKIILPANKKTSPANANQRPDAFPNPYHAPIRIPAWRPEHRGAALQLELVLNWSCAVDLHDRFCSLR